MPEKNIRTIFPVDQLCPVCRAKVKKGETTGECKVLAKIMEIGKSISDIKVVDSEEARRRVTDANNHEDYQHRTGRAWGCTHHNDRTIDNPKISG